MAEGGLSETDTITRDSADFFNLQSTWLFVLQYPIVTFILAIAQSITQAKGIYCLQGKKVYFAHLWVGGFSVSRLLTMSLMI